MPLLNKKYFFIVSIIITVAACKKFVQVDPPIDQPTEVSLFADDNTATAAWTGIYNNMMQTFRFLSSDITTYAGVSSDELSYFNPPANPFLTNSIPSDNSTINTMWQQAYQYIYQTNACMEGLLNNSKITERTKNQLTGEAKFVRALCYFYLVNLWGDVPLIISTDYAANATTGRTSKAQIYQQIISDLKDAQTLINDGYVKSDNTVYTTSIEKIRPNKSAVTALLSRVHLYTGDWSNAEMQSTTIINSGMYSLPALNSAFLKNNTEAIWQLQPINSSYNTLEGNRFIPFNVGGVFMTFPAYPLTNSLMNAFESGDQRKSIWVGVDVYSGTTYYFPYKYKVYSGNPPLNEYYTVLRLGEQYLIRAEARAQQNNLAGAISDLNVIRMRTTLADLPTSLNKTQVLAAVEQERRIELFAEWGHRWLDLKRTNRADPVLNIIKSPNWQITDILWPIPQSQININLNLTQNPGY